jgi:DNA (cytosine-5)-methyltransferase 1
MELTHASWFSGVGGLDLGLERAGWRTVSFSEIDPYASAVLRKHWPDVPNLGDIHAIESVPDATLWSGGFPCQPVSVAGKRLAQADERWLWPAWFRLIRAFRPRLLLLENVPGLLAGHGGMGDLLGDLASIGYDAEWDCLPAAAFGAPHLRYRVYIVAYPQLRELRLEPIALGGSGGAAVPRDDGSAGPLAHTDSLGLEGERSGGLLDRERQALGDDPDGRGSAVADPTGDGWQPRRPGGASQESGGRDFDRSAVESALADAEGVGMEGHRPARVQVASAQTPTTLSRRDGPGTRGDQWATEPDVDRVAHGVPARVDRLRCLGNAVVPQVAEWLGWRLREALSG